MADNKVAGIENHDFGFSFSDGTDLPEIKTSINDLQTRHDTVMKMINIFLDNLMKDPDKKYLLWPDRVTKVKEFQERLNKV